MKVIFAAAMALSAVPAAAEDALLGRLAGDWVGNGTFHQSADADAERVYCKIANTLVGDGNVLQQRGRCAVASNSGAIEGTIEAVGAGRYGGSLSSLASVGAATISGEGSGDTLVFEADYIDSRTKRPTRTTTTLAVGDGTYTLVSEQIDPDDGTRFVSTEIVFKPQ
jgi:hypothetical protein